LRWTLYYNLKLEKLKDQLSHSYYLVIKDASEAQLPKYRISLFGLLFKNHNFMKDNKIYHPFEYTITLKNYRYQTSSEEIVIKNNITHLT